jgi:5-methylcytosine-specific restriction endonuclease McrA
MGSRGKGRLLYRQRHPLCLGCAACDRVSAAELVDHVVPHKGDHSLFWDGANWQPSCRWHHDVVKQRIEALYLKREATKEDLRLDSAMAKAMSANR